MLHVKKNAKEISDVTLASEDDKDNSDTIECALEIVGTEFFKVTVATDDHNEDSVSWVDKNKNVKKIKVVTVLTSIFKKSVTKTEADPETRNYNAMYNYMVDDEDLYRQFCVNTGEQANKSDSKLLR